MKFPMLPLSVLLAAALSSCGSGPEPEDDGGDRSGPRQATAEESWAKAQEKESTADQVASFGRIQWLEESALEYQWLLDHHPRSRQAYDAQAKVKRIRERLDELKGWKRRWDDFDTQSRILKPKPAYLEKAREDAEALTAAPFPFVRDLAKKRLQECEEASGRTVQEAWARLEKAIKDAQAKKAWSGGFVHFGAFDPDYARVFPEYATKTASLKESFVAAAKAEADAAAARAERKFEADPSWAPVGILVRARERFAGLPFEADLRAKEREMRKRVLDKVWEERSIASKAKPPEPPPLPPDPEPAPEPAASPAAAPEENPKSPPPDLTPRDPLTGEPFPEPKELEGEGGDDLLTKADEWYFKAVNLERQAVPGQRDYQARLKAAVEAYQKVRDLYDHLLEKNKGPSEAIEDRLEKIQAAIFWCKKSMALNDE
ncbi:MAG: hypothetical protein MUC63_04700 [Planctomycetes bacterium]|nr:hypothetical protein [Planctomycetota bacterium]